MALMAFTSLDWLRIRFLDSSLSVTGPLRMGHGAIFLIYIINVPFAIENNHLVKYLSLNYSYF